MTGEPFRLPPNFPSLRETIDTHGLATRKSLGQHFLLDRNITDKITRLAGPLDGKTVLEIGPGPGGLTRSLLESGAANVVAVEKDSRCLEALQALVDVSAGRLSLVDGDAMTIDETTLCPAPVTIVSNLPYNISTQLVYKWLDNPEHFDSLTLMFQKEVADRLTASPGSKAYGKLSVLTHWHWHAEPVYPVPPRAFVPPPKVDSTVVRLTPRTKPLCLADPAALKTICNAAFNQRRKMLRASLRPVCDDPESILEAAGIDPTRRAETLTTEEFCSVSAAYAHRKSHSPDST